MALSEEGRGAKKTDAAEHRKVFGRIGLLFNEPPGVARLPFI
jgi:hypothetical protein